MNDYMASIMLFAGDFAPKGWAFCQGQLLQISNNPALFTLLGNRFGGDGTTTFCLPNIKHDNPDLHYIICMLGIFPTK